MLAGGWVGATRPASNSKLTGSAKASCTGPRVKTSGCSCDGIGGGVLLPCPRIAQENTKTAMTDALTWCRQMFCFREFINTFQNSTPATANRSSPFLLRHGVEHRDPVVARAGPGDPLVANARPCNGSCTVVVVAGATETV